MIFVNQKSVFLASKYVGRNRQETEFCDCSGWVLGAMTILKVIIIITIIIKNNNNNNLIITTTTSNNYLIIITTIINNNNNINN